MFVALAVWLEGSPRRSVRGLRILSRYYARAAHCIGAVNPPTEHGLFLRLVLTPSGGW
jgi:hypothetical protein